MPRPTRAYGRPATPVIPDGWDASHAAVIDTTHEGQILVAAPTAGDRHWDPIARAMVATGATAPVYDGPARFIAVADTTGAREAVDELQPIRLYNVFVEHPATGIEPGHVIDVVTNSDVDLVGRRLVVEAVKRGTHRFSRVLLARLTY